MSSTPAAPAVPEAFRDELQQTTAVQKALAMIDEPTKAWADALASYRVAAWAYQTAFSTHMAGDVAMQRQYLDELGARAARFVPGAATRDLQSSLESAKKNLADLESLLAANPGEGDRIERASE